MAQDILDQLYFGKISPWENNNDCSPEMQELKGLIDKDLQQLYALLSNEGKTVLKRLMENRSALEDCAVREGFKDGFRLGSKLAHATHCSGVC